MATNSDGSSDGNGGDHSQRRVATRPHSLAFAAPQYWSTWAFLLWLRLTALLPWRTAITLHRRLGRLLYRWVPRSGKVVRRNLEICFPGLDPPALNALVERSFECVGAFLAEAAFAWFGSLERNQRLFRIEGAEHLEAALAKGKGVLLFSGHFTPLEICVQAIKPLVPRYAFMFQSRSNALLSAVQGRGRLRTAHTSVANDDVRALLRMLRDNTVVWYAPDHAPSEGGELLPFFGEPAMTSTATSRLARLSGAAVVPLFYARLPDDSGYVVRFEAPLDDLPTDDARADTLRLVAVLERFVRECPEQYVWTHRRFGNRPNHLPHVY